MTAVLPVLAAVVALAFGVEVTLGFGATVIALALGSFVVPVAELVPVLLLLNLPLSAYVVLRYRAHVDRRLLLRGFLPWMGLGMPAGMALFSLLGGPELQRIFGAMVVGIGAVESWRLFHAPTRAAQLAPATRAGSLLLGGIAHGLYATGGPMAVYVAGRDLEDKAAFRATLSAVWLALNAVLVAHHVLAGRIGGEQVATAAWLLLPTLGGLVAGEWLHHRAPAAAFRRIIWALLCVIGVNVILRAG